MRTLVRIRWVDAQSVDGWESLEDVLSTEMAVCETAGFLIGETEAAYFVANSVNGTDAACTMMIPKVCVVEKTDL